MQGPRASARSCFDEEGVAGGRVVDRGDERGVGGRAGEGGDRGLAQGARGEGRGFGGDRLEDRAVLGRERRARSDQQRHRQLAHPPREVGEEAQAGNVGPLGVVDGQEQRLRGREVRDQPVEPVEAREAVAGRVGRVPEAGAASAALPPAPPRRPPARSSWRTTPKPNSCSRSEPDAVSTRAPEASSAAWRSRRVLPRPAAPSITTTAPRPSPRRPPPPPPRPTTSTSRSSSGTSVADDAPAVGEPAAGELGRRSARELVEVADHVRLVVVAAALRRSRPSRSRSPTSATARWKRRMRPSSFGETPTCSRKPATRCRRLQPSSAASVAHAHAAAAGPQAPERAGDARDRRERVVEPLQEEVVEQREPLPPSPLAHGERLVQQQPRAPEQRVEATDPPRQLVHRQPQQQVRADRREVDLHAALGAARSR